MIRWRQAPIVTLFRKCGLGQGTSAANRRHSLRFRLHDDSLRWFWSMTVYGPMTRSNRVATLEEAKAQFQRNWDAWKAWAKLEETE